MAKPKYVPPGGIEGEESLTECARRETLEETSLSVELGKIAYIREFVELGYTTARCFPQRHRTQVRSWRARIRTLASLIQPI